MTRHCRGCGVDISDTPKTHFTCRRCYGDAARKLATGKAFIGLTCASIGLDPGRVEQLVGVVDKSAPGAAEATGWLRQVQERLGRQKNG